MEIRINYSTATPLYQQIEEEISRLIAAGQFHAGDHLPTVRDLAHSLNVNPATVARVYRTLEQKGIVRTSSRRGTIITGKPESRQDSVMRQNRLSTLVNNHILEALSLGYSLDELEITARQHLARWRIEQEAKEMGQRKLLNIDKRSTIFIVGSHDLALNLLIEQLKQKSPEVNIQMTAAGSLGGLLALQEEKADMAGIHLLDEESGEYNYPYVKHILQDAEVAIVHLAYRIQGLMFAKGNPRQITGLEDLIRPDIIFINRQKGSGTRVALDYRLRQIGISPAEIKGYERELDTHLAVATCITRGKADVGLGIEAAALASGIDFLPVARERFDLIIPLENYRSKRLSPLLEIIKSQDFKEKVTAMGGYDVSQTGDTTFITRPNS